MTSALASTRHPVERIQPATIEQTSAMTLGDAINILSGQEHSPSLLAVETFFLKRLMDNLDTEEKAECYYYLLRCRLKKSRHFETIDALELYRKMRATYHHAEHELRKELATNDNAIVQTQIRAFYRRAIFHYATLENLYRAQNFNESAHRAAIDKMDLHKRAHHIEREWARYIGIVLFDLTSRYGHSFFRWGLTTLATLIGFSIIYETLDATTPVADRIIQEGANPIRYFYFTIVTFTTLGYGDFHPHTQPQMIAACVEVIIGYFMLGVFMNLMSQKL